MLYFTPPLSDKLPKGDPTENEIKNLSFIYLKKCIATRQLVKEDRNGVFKIDNLHSLEREILNRQNFLPPEITSVKSTGIFCFKPSLFRNVMSDTGIMGYYNPFTAEAQYNPNLPASALPFTLAHESAHQLGFAREQEANFVGFLCGRNSENAELRYSTEYFALKSLLNSLADNDPEFVKMMLKNYSPVMKRDRAYELAFQKKHSGMLDAFFGFTNNLFLKSNRQEGSITYSYFVELFVRYERSEVHQ